MMFFFFFKQKTAYALRISDWSSDVCSSDLLALLQADPEIADRIPEDKLAACFDARYHTKHVDTIFARVFGPQTSTPESSKDAAKRSEERRVGKEWVCRCRARWTP